jgi:hypothetical protein
MNICERIVLTPQEDAILVSAIEELEYAVLMPWITGNSWWDIVDNKQPLTSDQSLHLAETIAYTFAELESKGIAHCDIANTNVLFNLQQGSVSLIDIEEIYIPGLNRPGTTFGTPGYQHRHNPSGLWGPHADRFAGAVLLAEILGWHNKSVRQLSGREHFFDQDELQEPTRERFIALKQALRAWSPTLEKYFDDAWGSKRLSKCPCMEDWYQAILAVSTGNTPPKKKGPGKQPISWEPLSISSPPKATRKQALHYWSQEVEGVWTLEEFRRTRRRSAQVWRLHKIRAELEADRISVALEYYDHALLADCVYGSTRE